MNSVNTKIEKLRSIASSLGLQGESVEAIVQMLGYALHTSEVEHIAYSQEAMLERATNVNSKIQHCVNMMYSVYRGSNPRVIITLSPTKRFIFNPGDLVAKSNSYNVYYLGYWDNNIGEFIESGTTLYPGGEEYTRTILCVLSKYTVESSWKITDSNLYYKTIDKAKDRENAIFSSDYILSISDFENSDYKQVYTTRRFSEHERLNYFFDLTLPGFGMNIYYPSKYEGITSSRLGYIDKWMNIKVHEFFNLDSINVGELKQLKVSGSIPKETPKEILFAYSNIDTNYSYPESGLLFIKETEHDSIESIHYLANKNRYSGTYLSTNSDLSFLLSESFPNKVKQENGVACIFNKKNNSVNLFYVPSNASLDITNSEKARFIGENGSYFISKNIEINKATRYIANIVLELELYSIEDLTSEVSDILQKYQNNLDVDLGDEKHQTSDYLEIKSLISKISNVRYIKNMTVTYSDSNGNTISYENLKKLNGKSVFHNEYLTFSCLESGSFKFRRFQDGNLFYSTNGGFIWTKLENNVDSPMFDKGTDVLFKGTLTDQWTGDDDDDYQGVGVFSSSGKFEVSGNVLSILYGDDFKNKDTLTSTLQDLFSGCSKLVSAANLSFPSTTIPHCYSSMFSSCTLLETPPNLPSKTMSRECYWGMFYCCSSLKTAPVLPSLDLSEGDRCYESMFSGCSSLTEAPELPAVKLSDFCYSGMFKECLSLKKAPSLSAMEMKLGCYNNMFMDCISLISAPKLSSTTLEERCYSGMFAGCKNLVYAPGLPATEMKRYCYGGMFKDCIQLEKAPVLPATNIEGLTCYSEMFRGCSKLNYIKAMFNIEVSLNTGDLNSWVIGVNPSGTFVVSMDYDTEDIARGVSSIPVGWNIIKDIYSRSESDYEDPNSSSSIEHEEDIEIPYYFIINSEINSTMS